MKKLVYILSLILLVGCSGALKRSWNNFRAHYNTHYNAEKSFRAGLKQVEEQPVTINPDTPVRVHREPDITGSQHFESTIEKEVRLLRKFPNTKWADNALFLMGQSYYYQKEFYLALRKFEELYALDSDPQLKQQAVIWKGRTLLDLARHQEAILYLENELAILKEVWDPSLKAETQVLLGEHYAMVANWESSADYLNNSVSALGDKPFRGRTWFLYGQVLEQLNRYGAAFFAYNQVSSGFPDYEFIYWAEVKKGRVARMDGNLDQALSIFNSMKNDDKNFQRQHELNFEIARTQELKGNIAVAEQIYGQMLNTVTTPLSRDLQAKTYYRLGKIYSDGYQNYEVAAAYYDSSSMQISNSDLVNSSQNVEVLASAYENYASLKHRISKIDSLLWLGSLTTSELDSAIDRIREQKRHALQQKIMSRENASENILVNIGQINSVQENQSISQYGFLNYKNQNLIADSKSRFRAVWGRRPLVDNWRRIEAIVNMAPMSRGEGRNSVQTTEQGTANSDELSDAGLGIDLSEIPATREAKRELAREKAGVQYELGSLFFLTLDLPDSAAFYFRKIIKDRSKGELEVKSMYALFELYYLLQKEDRSEYWSSRIIQDYPNTAYARRVDRQINNRSDIQTNADSAGDLLVKVQALEDVPDSVSLSGRAEQFRALALDNRSSALAPYIHYRAIRDYVQLAKEQADSARYTRFWQSGKPDTGSVVARTERKEDTGIGPEPLFSGAYWDSVRIMIEEYDTIFDTAPHRNRLRELEKLLEEYEGQEGNLKTCSELGIKPEIKPGMDVFLSHIEVPRSVQHVNLPEEISYQLVIKSDGSVISHQLVSDSELPDLEEAYKKAVEEYLQFFPFEEHENLSESEVRCLVSFPVRRL